VNAIQTLRPRVRALLLERGPLTTTAICVALDDRYGAVWRALCSRWFEVTADGLRTYRLTEQGRAGT
jgi:hypothetical protein